MKKNRKWIKGAAAVTLSLSMMGTSILPNVMPVFAKEGITAYANTYATPNGIANFGKGSATITIKGNQGQSLVGKKFNVYKLFDAENAIGQESIQYTWNETYKPAIQQVVGKRLNKSASSVTEYEAIDYIQTLNTHIVEGANANQTAEATNSEFRKFVEELRDALVTLNLPADTVTVTQTKADNSVTFGGLDWGYYLADETTANVGTHAAASLCMVNTANPTAEVQIKSDYPSLIKKIEEDDNGIGWNDIGDFEIGQTVPYKYETTAPNMNGYSTYYLAFHDKMDEALTFDKDSVSITISSATKSYKVKASEMKIIENVDGETFKIEISDLKAIIDREFAEGMNNHMENTYGQSIVVNYHASLNDKAAENTGRDGFENTVRLEFSNDPDSDGIGETGYTPWDTVVCFTYKINGLKVNNHDTKLEGAKFRLYSDADCKNEVYVKKTDAGYNVINRDLVGGDDHTGGTRPSEAVEMVSDAKGVFTIFGLDGGTYYLKETDAPDGYRPIEDAIVITVTPTYTNERNQYVAGAGATDKVLTKLEATAHIKQFITGAWNDKTTALQTDVQEGSMNLTVVNQVGTKLPITGSSANIMTAVVMLAAGSVVVYAHKKRKETTEK